MLDVFIGVYSIYFTLEPFPLIELIELVVVFVVRKTEKKWQGTHRVHRFALQ